MGPPTILLLLKLPKKWLSVSIMSLARRSPLRYLFPLIVLTLSYVAFSDFHFHF